MVDSREHLRALFARRRSRKALTVYVSQKSVSRSGMMRRLLLHIIRDGELIEITQHVAEVAGFSFDRDAWAIKVHGCGMNMHFHAVYELSHALFGDGYRLQNVSI